MARCRPAEINDAGQDSFLDVVTNIVGILIILVMVIGGRVQQIVLAPPPAVVDNEPLAREVRKLAETVASTESEIDELQTQTRTVATAAAYAADARLQLTTAVSAAKAMIERRRQEGEAAGVAAAEQRARRQALEDEIARVRREAEVVATAPADAHEILAYPTPIGRTVNGEEMHFRIAGGRIAYIPLEELFQLAKQHTQRHSGPIAQLASRIETVGPEQGFTLDYVIEAKIGFAACSRGPSPRRRSRSGATPTASPPTGRFGRNCTGSTSRRPVARCPPAPRSAAPPKAASPSCSNL